MTQTETKYCKQCDQDVPVTNFYKLAASKDGLQYRCIDCARTSHKHHNRKIRAVAKQSRERDAVALEEAMTCGVDGHKSTCLCDVVISEITPVNVKSVTEIWGGSAICNMFDLAGPWEPETLLEFFEKLLYGYDMNAGSASSIRNVRPKIVERGNESLPQYWKRIRIVVDDVFHESPDANIVDVLEMIGVPPEDFRDMILSRRVMPDWTMETLREMQADARAQISKNEFCRKYRLNPDKGRSGDRVYRLLAGTHYVDRAFGGPLGGQTEQSAEVEQYIQDNPALDRTSLLQWHRQRWPDTSSSTRSNQIRRALIRAGRLEGKR